MRRRALALALLGVGLLVAACGRYGPPVPPRPEPPPPATAPSSVEPAPEPTAEEPTDDDEEVRP
ncbi:MAG: hypothetical protein AAF430_07555 [Myxococcota bacterium]